jgi:hypothetical protein
VLGGVADVVKRGGEEQLLGVILARRGAFA